MRNNTGIEKFFLFFNFYLPYFKINRLELKIKLEKMNEIIEKIYQEKNLKLRWDLVPWNALEKIVEVITKGAQKYGIDNWKFISTDIFEAALMRHFVEYKKGQHFDDEWKLTHLAHLACNSVFLLWKELLLLGIIENENEGELKSNGALENNKKNGEYY